jgi:RNase P/RNase MRP subunit POP5
MGIRLIRFDGMTGIVKCNHTEKEKTIKLLQSIVKISSQKVQVETFGTSGTIKALMRKHIV